MSTLFEGKEHACLYIRYRPEYPVELYDRIFEYLDEGVQEKRRTLVVDVGCGSGQTTRVLASYFNDVFGVDASKAQLEEARQSCSSLANVRFQHGFANDLSKFLTDGSVDLVNVATALHWFNNVEAFFGECLRIMRHGAVLVAFSYGNPHLDDEMADGVLCRFTDVKLRHYWALESRHVWNRYQDLFLTLQKFFPTSERDDSIEIRVSFSIKEFCGLIATYSAYQTYRRQNPTSPDPLIEMAKELEVIYGTQSEDEKVVNGHLSIFMLLGKKL